MSDYYCPHCGADLGDQYGFDPDAGYWTCTECGQFLMDDDIADGGSVTNLDFDVDAALRAVNSELNRYTNRAEGIDYFIGVVSGIMAGVIDATFVGEIQIDGKDIGLSHQQVNNFIQEYAKSRGFENDRLKDAISDLEQAFKVAQDNVWKGAGTLPLPLILIGLRAVPHIDRVPKVNHVLKHIRHHITGPVIRVFRVQTGVGDPVLGAGVHGRRVNAFVLELFCDLGRSHAAGAHGEDAFHDHGRFLVYHKRRFLFLSLAVTVGSAGPDPDAPLRLSV